MTAPTVAVEWLLARAAVRQTGLLHVVSRRDSGALNPVCGANPIRSTTIDERTQLDDIALLCPGCATMAASIGGTIRDGVALLLGLSAAATTTRLLELPITAIDIAATHARTTPGDPDGLIASITERGVIAPVVVRRRGDRFEVIDGARRIHAAHFAGHDTVPAVVRDATDEDALLDQLTANLHRRDLNPIEQATAYRHALDTLDISKAELARRLGVSRVQISNTIRLLNLPIEEQERIASGEMTASSGRAALAGPTTIAAADPALAGIADLLVGLLDAKVKITAAAGDRRRITIDVPQADLARVLEQIGLQTAA